MNLITLNRRREFVYLNKLLLCDFCMVRREEYNLTTGFNEDYWFIVEIIVKIHIYLMLFKQIEVHIKIYKKINRNG